jgi:hypothetical protein
MFDMYTPTYYAIVYDNLNRIKSWRSLPDKEKRKIIKAAEKAKEVYDKQLKEYNSKLLDSLLKK